MGPPPAPVPALGLRIRRRSAASGRLAEKYQRSLTYAATRPHPRCPRTGPLRHVAFWLHGRWDRLLDTMDSRPGVGDGFPVPAPDGGPTPAADEDGSMSATGAD